jgi:hypothetical protein
MHCQGRDHALGQQMNRKAAIFGAAVGWALGALNAQAEDKEPTAVVALGPAGEWAFPGGKSSLGPSASVEFSVIKDWLEIEVGGASLFRRGRTGWETDVLFKKPFTLSNTVELMIGAGPTWSYANGETGKTGATMVLDFMFWPSPERKFGWFFEPTYT